ncbi:protein FAM136A [Aplysia californica]|uniref:Protein FAM136A n=1 Tax=Aplysia californica TaxID=6500 RepID=A0ABM0JIG9_APLCA|nr:protein FAM136A [Aplysia californica]
MDGAQARVQEAISKMVNTLDTGCLRKMQVDMYNCSAKCCENPKYSLDEVQKCIEDCSLDVNRAQAYLQNEIESFQNRLQRCAMSCQDKLKDQMPVQPSDADVQRGRSSLEQCVVQCADSHVGLVPDLTKKMLETLKKKKY